MSSRKLTVSQRREFWVGLILDDYQNARTFFSNVRGGGDYKKRHSDKDRAAAEAYLQACIEVAINPICLTYAGVRRDIALGKPSFIPLSRLVSLTTMNCSKIEKQSIAAARSKVSSTLAAIDSLRQQARIDYGEKLSEAQWRAFIAEQPGDPVVICGIAKMKPTRQAKFAYLSCPGVYEDLASNLVSGSLRKLPKFEDFL